MFFSFKNFQFKSYVKISQNTEYGQIILETLIGQNGFIIYFVNILIII